MTTTSELLTRLMIEAEVPIFFGEVPKKPFPAYPLPHTPGQKMLDGAIKVIEAVQVSDVPEENRHEAISILLLQLYLHGYSAGAMHTQRAGVITNAT